MSGERSSGSTYDLGNVSDSGSLSRYSKSTVRRHRRVSHFEVEFALYCYIVTTSEVIVNDMVTNTFLVQNAYTTFFKILW